MPRKTATTSRPPRVRKTAPKPQMTLKLPEAKQFNVHVNNEDYEKPDRYYDEESAQAPTYIIETDNTAEAAFVAVKLWNQLHPKEAIVSINIDERGKKDRVLFVPHAEVKTYLAALNPPPAPALPAEPPSE